MMRLVYKPNGETHKIADAAGDTMYVPRHKGKMYPVFGTDRIAGIKTVRIRKDDVLLCGYPKTGCHWVYEIIYMLVNKKSELSKYGKGIGGMIDAMPHFLLDSLPSPRVLNSHVLYDELPQQVMYKRNKIIGL